MRGYRLLSGEVKPILWSTERPRLTPSRAGAGL